MKKRIYIVRFQSMESRKKALDDGVKLFDKKPLIVEPWSPNMDMKKTEVEKVPIWVKFPELDLKYWGPLSLKKIAGIIGTLIKADRATTERELLSYAWVMIEVSVRLDLPNVIEFMDEWGHMVLQEVKYEWKPIYCHNCGGMGHDTEKCIRLLCSRTKGTKWVPKVPRTENVVQPRVYNEGFQTPKNPLSVKHNVTGSSKVVVGNNFVNLTYPIVSNECEGIDDFAELQLGSQDISPGAGNQGVGNINAGGGEPPPLT